jgi:hypothetical protein
MFWLRFCRSDSFSLMHFHTSADLNAPHCEAGLIRSERAYLLFLSLHTSKRSRYRGSLSWVAFKLKEKWPKPRQLRTLGLTPGSKQFRPMSDRNRDRNLQPRDLVCQNNLVFYFWFARLNWLRLANELRFLRPLPQSEALSLRLKSSFRRIDGDVERVAWDGFNVVSLVWQVEWVQWTPPLSDAVECASQVGKG